MLYLHHGAHANSCAHKKCDENKKRKQREKMTGASYKLIREK